MVVAGASVGDKVVVVIGGGGIIGTGAGVGVGAGAGTKGIGEGEVTGLEHAPSPTTARISKAIMSKATINLFNLDISFSW